MLNSWRELKLRTDLVAVGERLERQGLIRGCQGNFSAVVDEGTFLVSPRGRRKGRLQAWEMIRATFEEPLPPEASSEGLLHQSILARWKNFKVVIHAHPPQVLKLLSRGQLPDPKQLRETGHMQCALLPNLPPSSRPLAETAATAAGRANVLLLPCHGAVAMGRDCQEALELLESLELLSFLALES